jgi:hypothetical protein
MKVLGRFGQFDDILAQQARKKHREILKEQGIETEISGPLGLAAHFAEAFWGAICGNGSICGLC